MATSEKQPVPDRTVTPGTAAVFLPLLPGDRDQARSPDARLQEAVGLAQAIELSVVADRILRVNRPTPATLFGGGAVAELGGMIAAEGVEVVIIDATLSPVQQRNLEKAWQAKVIDRTGLILEIFGARARTREGQLQVDLAHLGYQRSRLVRSWTHLERQRGGAGFLGGPGERQIELDRRLIDDRLVQLRRDLEEVRRTRGLHRSARARVPFPVVALVGYTNAGKSTLFNRLTRSAVVARDQLFATLDPTMRAVDLQSGKRSRRVILSDTVGFISALPTHLVEAFRATLEEVQSADLILHVRDISHPDTEAQRADVIGVLRDLGVDAEDPSRVMELLNKADLLEPETADRLRSGGAVLISAVTGEGCADLVRTVTDRLDAGRQVVTVRLAPEDGRTLAWLHERGYVVGRRDEEDGFSTVEVSLEPADIARLERRLQAD